jgi:hypothetical protein
MTRPLVSLFLLVILFGFAPGQAQVQTINRSKPPVDPSTKPKLDPVLEKKALDLLESISDQIVNLRSSTNRLRAESAVADLLWTRNEKRARALFNSAAAQLATRISELDYGDQEAYQEIMRINQSRQELVTRVATNDPELALTILRQTRLQMGNNSRNHWYAQNDINLEMNVANQLAAKDPARALELARENLSRGLTWNVISFLTQLHQKDPKSAAALYEDIVTRIKDEHLARHPELANITWNLLMAFQPPQAAEAIYRDLLTTVLSEALSIDRRTQTGLGLSQNFYHHLESLKPVVEKYAPTRVAELRDWSQAVEQVLDPSTKIHQELNRLSQNGTVDDILALAAKQTPDNQNMLYQSAVWKALAAGDAQRAREIAELITDPVSRRQTLDGIDNQLANRAESSNKAAEARRLIDKTKHVNRKIEILIQMANMVAGADKKVALELLAEARAILSAVPLSSVMVIPQLRVAQAYLTLDPDQSFALLQPLLPKLNELVAAAATLDGIDARYLKEGEWEMPGTNNLGNVVNTLNQTLAALGQSDFDRAHNLAEQIERPEIRLLVEIDLAQSVLSGKPIYPGVFSGGRGFSSMYMIH